MHFVSRDSIKFRQIEGLLDPGPFLKFMYLMKHRYGLFALSLCHILSHLCITA